MKLNCFCINLTVSALPHMGKIVAKSTHYNGKIITSWKHLKPIQGGLNYTQNSQNDLAWRLENIVT